MTEKITFEEYLGLRNLSKNTKRAYLIWQNVFKRDGYDLNQNDIDKFLSQHNNNVVRAMLKALLEYYSIKDIEIVKPTGRKKDKIRRFLAKEEVLDIVHNLPEKEKYITWLIWETGLRINEVMDLKKYDIDLANLQITGIGKGGKAYKLPISEKFANTIVIYLDGYSDEEYPFRYVDVKHSTQKYWYRLKKLSKEMGYHNVHPHRIRHAIGYHLRAELGMDLMLVAKALRHSNIATTKIYADATEEEMIKNLREKHLA